VELGLLLIGGVGAGLFGSLLGLGGGVLIVPLLTLGAGLPIRDAVGVSLVCVIVTSGASASVFLRRRVANLRLGMVLELATAAGALIGGFVAFLLDERMLAFLFAILLGYVALTMLRAGRAAAGAGRSGAGAGSPATASVWEPPPADRLSGPGYRVRRLWVGTASGLGAGVVSALLGIGGGVVMVPAMHLAMGVPLRVATATSNLMIGVTATASAIIYLLRGGIDAYVAGPTAIGVFVGAAAGSRVAGRIDLGVLRLLFVVVQAYVAVQMLIRALGTA
jgi:uncharacterized membrane protein YfcA